MSFSSLPDGGAWSIENKRVGDNEKVSVTLKNSSGVVIDVFEVSKDPDTFSF